MIVLFTDFGVNGPYVGQVKAVLYHIAPDAPIIDLFHNAPSFNPGLSAYLLAAYSAGFPPGTVFLCVVDPGVGTLSRDPVVVYVDGYWFVGPNNGLFDVLCSKGDDVRYYSIGYKPETLSNTFHGRDLFAPVAGLLAVGDVASCVLDVIDVPVAPAVSGVAVVIYVDDFGNCLTALTDADLQPEDTIKIGDVVVSYARTFGEVSVGSLFWYYNANCLVELAVNCGSAAQRLGLTPGDKVDDVYG